jgi:hypothetical protein
VGSFEAKQVVSIILFVACNGLAATASRLAAGIAFRDSDRWRRSLATLVGFPLLIVPLLLALGSIGQFTAKAALAALLGLNLFLFVAAKRWSAKQQTAPSTSSPPLSGLVLTSPLGLISGSLLSAFAGQWLYLTTVLGTEFSWDDLSYHAPATAHWLADGRISLAPFNYHAYFPFNAEVLSAWFMLPSGTDGLVSLSGLCWGLLLVAATLVLLIEARCSSETAALPAAILLGCPIVLGAARTFSATDLAPCAALLSALAFSVDALGGRNARDMRSDALYAGFAAGFAAGCKAPFLLPTFVLALWHFWHAKRAHGARNALRLICIFGAAALVTGSYWYARTWWITGNPFYPAKVGPFWGPLGSLEQHRTTLAHWFIVGHLSTAAALLKSHLGWPIGMSVVSATGYLLGLRSLFRRRDAGSLAQARNLALLIGGCVLVAYPFMPFSGTNNEALGLPRVELRFALTPFVIGVLLFGLELGRAGRAQASLFCIGTLALVTAGIGDKLWGPVHVLACVGFLCFAHFKTALLAGWRLLPRRVLFFPLPLLLLLLVALWSPYKQRMTDSILAAYGDSLRPVGRGWQALQQLPSGSRVTWFGPSTYQYYPMFGRRLQLVPVALDEDGSVLPPLHRAPAAAWWADSVAAPNADAFRANLRRAKVDFVFVSKWSQDAYPVQQAQLASWSEAHAVYDDSYSTVWALHEASPPQAGQSGRGAP